MAITKATTLADVGSAVGDSPTQVLNIGSVDISGQAGIITATTLNAKSTGLSGDPDISINQMNCGGIATFTDEIDSRSGLVVTSGIITATSFSGNVTGVAATFSGNVEVGGTLSYEDVANVDSTGIITSQKAILAQGYGITATNIEVTGVTTFSGSTTLGSLHIKSATPGLRLEDTDASGTPISYIYGSGGSISLQADEASETGNSDIDFRIDGSEKMRIKGSGKIGIGTNVPSSVVSILDATEPDIEFVVGLTTTFVINADSSNIELKGTQSGDTINIMTNSIARVKVADAAVTTGVGITQTNAGDMLQVGTGITMGGAAGAGNLSICGVLTANGVTMGQNAIGARTVQSGGSPSGGDNGDIVYIY